MRLLRHCFVPTYIIAVHVMLGVLAVFLIGCDTQPEQQATQIESLAVANRPLATVQISPTPNAEQRRATSIASSPTPTPLTPTPTSRPTEYVGVFIGEAEPLQGALVDPDVFASISTPVPPTVAPAECTTAIDPAYLPVWRNDSLIAQRMGCPIQIGIGFAGDVQVFAGGAMYRRDETGELWAMIPEQPTGQYFYFEIPPDISTTGITPPTGFIVPSGDFGGAWMSETVLQDQIGFAQTPPLGVNLGFQRFAGGTFFLDSTSGQIFALLADGTLYGPFLAGITTGEGTTVPDVDAPEATDEPSS